MEQWDKAHKFLFLKQVSLLKEFCREILTCPWVLCKDSFSNSFSQKDASSPSSEYGHTK